MATTIAQITITLDSAGQLNVAGSTEQTMLCFGMMEMAKVVLVKMMDQAMRSIQPATLSDLNLVQGGGKQS